MPPLRLRPAAAVRRVWQPRGRAEASLPRVLAAGFLLAVAVSGLTACRTSPERRRLRRRRAGDRRRAGGRGRRAAADDPTSPRSPPGSADGYTRRVLAPARRGRRCTRAAAERYGVAGRRRRRAGPDRTSCSAATTRTSVYAQLAQRRASAGPTSSRPSASSWSARRSPRPRALADGRPRRELQAPTRRCATSLARGRVRLHHRARRGHRRRGARRS